MVPKLEKKHCRRWTKNFLKANHMAQLTEEAAGRRSTEEQARCAEAARVASAQQVCEAAEARQRAEAQARHAEDERQATVRKAGEHLHVHEAARQRAEAGEREARAAIGGLRSTIADLKTQLERADAAIGDLRTQLAAHGRQGAGGAAPQGR